MSENTLGRYQIIREIARSNDIVYEAVDASINRRVALKELLLPPNLVGVQKRERVQRFYREARAAGALSHPNIVTIYEAGEDHGRHFIAMEYLEGQTLRDVLQIEGQIPIDKAVSIVKQVCDALAYAHSKGVVHRDIKPDNIQILPSGLIKVTDFGIARIMDEPSITADGQVFGTPSYMSPEQVAGKPLDQRTDIFSLGIVFFEMLTGRKPFTGDSVVTITYNIMNQDVTMPPSLPPHLARLIERSLAKDPDFRYKAATEMAADLDPSSFDNLQPTSQVAPFGPAFDQFASLQPDALSLPRTPGKPILSAEAKYFLKVMFVAVSVCGAVILFIWLLSAGYQGYQRKAKEEVVGSRIRAGTEYMGQQSYQAAIEQFNGALRLSTDAKLSAAIRHNIAVAYINLGVQAEREANINGAIEYYRSAVKSDQSSADAYLYLGNAYSRAGREAEAFQAWESAMQLGGGSGAGLTARQNLAAAYIRHGDDARNQGDVENAKQWWRKAVDIAPGTDAGFQAQDRLDRVLGGPE